MSPKTGKTEPEKVMETLKNSLVFLYFFVVVVHFFLQSHLKTPLNTNSVNMYEG